MHVNIKMFVYDHIIIYVYIYDYQSSSVRLTELQRYHPSLQLWDQASVQRSSNVALKDILTDFNFWDLDQLNGRSDGEVEGGRISRETFIRYHEIMSFYTDSEVNFERNLASIFVITPEDMLDYIVKKRATVDSNPVAEEYIVKKRASVDSTVAVTPTRKIAEGVVLEEKGRDSSSEGER